MPRSPPLRSGAIVGSFALQAIQSRRSLPPEEFEDALGWPLSVGLHSTTWNADRQRVGFLDIEAQAPYSHRWGGSAEAGAGAMLAACRLAGLSALERALCSLNTLPQWKALRGRARTTVRSSCGWRRRAGTGRGDASSISCPACVGGSLARLAGAPTGHPFPRVFRRRRSSWLSPASSFSRHQRMWLSRNARSSSVAVGSAASFSRVISNQRSAFLRWL